jgi:hypothetical protein
LNINTPTSLLSLWWVGRFAYTLSYAHIHAHIHTTLIHMRTHTYTPHSPHSYTHTHAHIHTTLIHIRTHTCTHTYHTHTHAHTHIHTTLTIVLGRKNSVVRSNSLEWHYVCVCVYVCVRVSEWMSECVSVRDSA